MQLLNLHNDVKTLTDSLSALNDIASYQNARLLHLNQGQLQLALVLNHTEAALNQTISIVNQHSSAISRQDVAIENLATYT